MDIKILFEDQDLVVIEKPPGVVVNETNTQSAETETIQSWWKRWLAQHPNQVSESEWQKLIPADWTDEFGSADQIFAERQGIVHRLDKETSGALLLAKHPGSLINLLMQFRLRQVSKKYLCLVHGKFKVTEDTISLPIGRSSIDRLKFQVVPDGRASETMYRVLNSFVQLDKNRLIEKLKNDGQNTSQIGRKIDRSYQGFSLVECQPKTGRTHQIRVHMTHLRHPLVADPTYVGHKRLILDQLWCPRLFLHAAFLSWQDLRMGDARTVESPLPPDLQRAVDFLQEHHES